MKIEFSISEKLSALYWLMRPLNSSTAAIAVVVAIHMAFGNEEPNINPFNYIFVAGAAFFVTAHSMVHNDIVDFELDKINSPHRALPSGKISVLQAKIWSLVLGLLAIASALLIDVNLNILPFSIFWALMNMFILDFYNIKLKQSGLFGNLVIGYAVSALFIYADIIINNRLTTRPFSIGLYAFFLIWGREVLKDVIDLEGDKEHGMKTIPVRFGIKSGVVIGSGIILIGVLSSIPLILNPLESLLVPIILIILNIIIVFMCIGVIRNPDRDLIFKFKLWLLRFLLIALLILVIDQIINVYL